MITPENDIHSFAFILYRCAITFRNELNKQFYKEFGDDLTVDYWFILSTLWESDNILQNLLAEKTNRDRASLSRTLDGMEEKGLIKRIADANNKRSLRIVLTKKSIGLRDTATSIAKEFTEKELEGLSLIEVKELMRMLNQIYFDIKD